MSPIVSSATPLVAFAKIDQLPLLQRMVDRLLVPPAVTREIEAYAQQHPRLLDLEREPWIEMRPVESDRQVKLLLPSLDRAEAEAIALALEQQAAIVLTDELTSRKVAESLNLSITGSVGVLIRAKQVREILAVKPFLDAMTQQGIYFSPRFINAVLRVVGEV